MKFIGTTLFPGPDDGEPSETKVCIICQEIKEIDEFYVHKQMLDGRLNKCKTCCVFYAKTKRETDPAVRERDKARAKSPKRKAHSQANMKRWRAENPEKYKAHNALNNAVRDGLVVRLPCRVCGSTESHGHHTDYSKPLEVDWLCALHHQEEHKDSGG